jgi:hypothetical protein
MNICDQCMRGKLSVWEGQRLKPGGSKPGGSKPGGSKPSGEKASGLAA